MSRAFKGFLLLFILILVGLSCNLPGSEADAPVDEDAPAVSDNEEPDFLDIIVTPHDAGKIIILEVYSDGDKYVTGVVLQLPERLQEAEIFANDQLLSDVSIDGGDVHIDLAGKMSAKTVTFTFKLEGIVESVCVIDMNDPLQPGEDCDF